MICLYSYLCCFLSVYSLDVVFVLILISHGVIDFHSACLLYLLSPQLFLLVVLEEERLYPGIFQAEHGLSMPLLVLLIFSVSKF